MSKAVNNLSRNSRDRAPRHTIRVPDEIIATAKRSNSGHCPGADGLKWTVPHATNISVDLQTVRYSDREKGLRYVYLTPRVLQEFIVGWDAGDEIGGFTYHLAGASIHNIAKRQANGRRKPPGKKKVLKPYKPGGVPQTKGGHTPPLGNTRRQFGLRAFERKPQTKHITT